MKTFKDFKEGVNRAQQAAIAISKKKSGKYDKDGKKIKEQQGPCWDGYKQVGMKKKGDKMVPNCVPVGEEMDPRDHVKKKDDKYVIVAPSGKVVKTFDDKKDAEDWVIKNHDVVMKEVKQDSDIKDKEGTQPAKYYAGDMSKSTKEKRAAHFSKKKSGPAPGDASAKTKPSKHTKKYKQMYGEENLNEKIEILTSSMESERLEYKKQQDELGLENKKIRSQINSLQASRKDQVDELNSILSDLEPMLENTGEMNA